MDFKHINYWLQTQPDGTQNSLDHVWIIGKQSLNNNNIHVHLTTFRTKLTNVVLHLLYFKFTLTGYKYHKTSLYIYTDEFCNCEGSLLTRGLFGVSDI